MFIPLSDTNPLRHLPFQYVTVGLIALNAAVYVLFLSDLVFPSMEATVYGFGMIPAVVNDYAELEPGAFAAPDLMTLVTYQFLHGGWMHLISNMLFLWVFGDNVEDALGHIRFLGFYLACGVIGGLAHLLAAPDSQSPLIGASGAVAGVIGAYLVLHPRVRVWVLLLGRLPLRIPALYALGGWIGMQFASIAFALDDQVAWWAHIGGAAAGAILVVLLRRPGVPLFDRGLG
ncbi:MAG: rhomboid family intramembrane serine protease [Rhodobiaceae bacterium]|nr:rhomboid family intramembrane serine protease [Rhodobiaceae bacterium]MCC0016747.1 rhomboid family intramembrane serine protease [Rhodobiaceae bacterium]MCC0042172.1 rhomboid family intramembrane serine protease [Rhodobiaceae bacterium]